MIKNMRIARRLVLATALAGLSFTAQAGAYDDLIAAAFRDDTEAVVGLLDRGLDVNSVDPAGNTLLHIASRNGSVPFVDALLKRRANTQARNRVGDTPLMLAAYNGKLEVVDRLIAGGAEVNPASGWTSLHYAVFNSQEAMVSHLLSKGAAVDARAPNQQTALMLAARMGNRAIVTGLLAAGADKTLTDQNGETAFSQAMKYNNTEIAQMIEQGVKPKAVQPAVLVIPPASEIKVSKPVSAVEAAATKPAAAPVDDNRGEYVSPPFQVAPSEKP